jgi:polysaccharide export outer membrane protein
MPGFRLLAAVLIGAVLGSSVPMNLPGAFAQAPEAPAPADGAQGAAGRSGSKVTGPPATPRPPAAEGPRVSDAVSGADRVVAASAGVRCVVSPAPVLVVPRSPAPEPPVMVRQTRGAAPDQAAPAGGDRMAPGLPQLDVQARAGTDQPAAAPAAVTTPPVVRHPEQEPLSRIEEAFQAAPLGVALAGSLRQFGYSAFSANVSTFAPVDDIPVGPDYVLGPGDDLTIHIWGSVDSTIVRTVDRNGRIVLPRVGDLRVWGLPFSEAERLIREQLARYFLGFQTSVTMGRLRTIRVHVVGEVCQPGVYTLSSLSTLTNALYAAGGPTRLGSLRNVWLFRNHQAVGALDLYDFLLRGDRSRDYRLESGDTVFVPTVGDVVAVAGEVKRPAVYEFRGTLRVAELLEMAGGVTPSAYLRRVQIVRAEPSAERVVIDVDLTRWSLAGDAAATPFVRSGDLVLIHRSDPRIYNVVKVAGAVKYPGSYELKPMMRLSELLPPDRLLPEAFPDRVEVARRREDLSLEILAVNLRRAWAGEPDQDVLLRPLDEVTVRTELRPVRQVTLGGQLVRPGVYPITEGERLSSVLERAGGFTDKAYLRGAVFTREALRRLEREQLEAFLKLQEQRILAAAGTQVVGGDKDEAALSAQTLQARRDLLRALASRVVLGRMVIRLDTPERLRGTEDDIILMDGDTLDVPEPPASVLVLGAVRNPTSVLYQRGAGLEYYLNRVGGLSREADRKEIHVVKADGSAVTSFVKVREIEPGDTIVVPPKEETKVRALPTIRDVMQIIGSSLLSLAALAALL